MVLDEGSVDVLVNVSRDTAVAHPSIPNAVMNYDWDAADHNYAKGSAEWSRVDDEPNCSPHPMDIMALHALYQTLNP